MPSPQTRNLRHRSQNASSDSVGFYSTALWATIRAPKYAAAGNASILGKSMELGSIIVRFSVSEWVKGLAFRVLALRGLMVYSVAGLGSTTVYTG